MNRLTTRRPDGQATVDCDICELRKQHECGLYGCRQRIKDRLAEYEDTGLSPEDIREIRKLVDFDQLKELLKAEAEGRLVVLPCKVGDTLFFVLDGKIYRAKVRFLRWEQSKDRGVHSDITANITPYSSVVAPFGDIGKTVFFSREEAEAALKAKEEEK